MHTAATDQIIITIAAILSSCGMYKEPCEGVGSIEISSEKKI